MISDVSVEKNEDDDESSVMSNKFRVLSLRQSLKVIRLAVRFPAGWSVSNSLLSYGLFLISYPPLLSQCLSLSMSLAHLLQIKTAMYPALFEGQQENVLP